MVSRQHHGSSVDDAVLGHRWSVFELPCVIVPVGETGGVDAEEVVSEQFDVGCCVATEQGVPDAGFECDELVEVHRLSMGRVVGRKWLNARSAGMQGCGMVDHLARPDQHLDPVVAANYDASVAERFEPALIESAVAVLSELANGGSVVEFAIGTGRLALPLAAAGVPVSGLDASQPMLDQLAKKPGAERVPVTIGDMTSAQIADDAALVYLVFNTIGNLRTQAQQVACFRNAAAHLAVGGRFLIQNNVPKLASLPPGETIRPNEITPHHLGFDEFIDRVNQILVSHHYYVDGDRVRTLSGAFRYVWPSELDLMAQLAGMTLESRWADWDRTPFTDESPAHVSVWRKA